jgi:hypothetical protein
MTRSIRTIALAVAVLLPVAAIATTPGAISMRQTRAGAVTDARISKVCGICRPISIGSNNDVAGAPSGSPSLWDRFVEWARGIL